MSLPTSVPPHLRELNSSTIPDGLTPPVQTPTTVPVAPQQPSRQPVETPTPRSVVEVPAPIRPASWDHYNCLYCRSQVAITPSGNCPKCGAPASIETIVSKSGWEELPGAADMAVIQFGHSKLQIEGNFVPVADFKLEDDANPIWFSHHRLVWVEEGIHFHKYKDGKSRWKKQLAGMPVHLLEARGTGHVALSDNHPGELIALPLAPKQGMWVREHVFVAATQSTDYDYVDNHLMLTIEKQTHDGTEREHEYPIGQYGDVFHTHDAPGFVLLHSPGNTMFRDLKRGETVYVQPHALVYRDLGVKTHFVVEYPKRTKFNLFRHRNYHLQLALTGPGRVAISSKYEPTEIESQGSIVGGARIHDWN